MSLLPIIHQGEQLIPRNQVRLPVSIMGHETNIDSIRALEKQIEEGNGDTIKLKRARNSLLNISTRVPPEILSHIFVWSLFRAAGRSLASPSHFDGLRKGSYNFLLVCHHWFEVASRTPELWSFWGNTMKDWKKRHRRCGAAPLDLILLDEYGDGNSFDGPLRDALIRRVVQDTIRQAHLKSYDHDALTSIISSLTPNGEGGQNENIESIVWQNMGFPSVDISHFFARSRLSRLRLLDLSGRLWISSWDRLTSRTTFLTALSLQFNKSSLSPTLTTSQLFSILTSNPNIQELRLLDAALPNDTSGSTTEVSLRDLRVLSLTGEFHHVFGLLRRFTLPQTLDELSLTGTDPTIENISQTLAPYMRDYFQRDARFQDTLSMSSSAAQDFTTISIHPLRGLTIAPAPRVMLSVAPNGIPPPEAQEQLFINLIMPFPRERVTLFSAALDMKLPEELLITMPNIERLTIFTAELSEGFLQPNPNGPRAKIKLLPSLRSLSLINVTLEGGNWDHLTTYLAHQTSDDQIISLTITGEIPDVPPEVAEGIKGLVKEFICYQAPRMSSV